MIREKSQSSHEVRQADHGCTYPFMGVKRSWSRRAEMARLTRCRRCVLARSKHAIGLRPGGDLAVVFLEIT
jgi:hypothetical protein